ncbi:hypothetical protein HanRHA438_Chr06g0264821 [Helianthus annuus]|uniref:Uncharacterized protein n=1 Tax=Helianthus annuus TaxID=4232 RepID=A0A251UIC7_HELAN|nr:uncharacterized protein LOC110865226 [Helianthus annuus]KAF5802087.1 hypothetical protein HanXRQr2_Chr06g0255541 [Helianthus annuus]KAJ0573296.1 hypothetical protein HanHA89_Chr06g0225171 [Helianthus annuus]KAJ0911591.1 hypothetical protein HanRHA438_Chr06g0264821 [Helianthus annuus]KAJ0915157.1 hypothetical protein HanPSC8_Chr06g0246721 [Helianthus annuus]
MEKRRLPSWMVSASTTNKVSKVSKPIDLDSSSVVTSDEVSVVTKSTKLKAKGVARNHKKEVGLSSDESLLVTKPKAKGVARNHKKEVGLSSDESLLVKCETKRKKRGFVEKDVVDGPDHDHDRDHDQEVNVEKRKRARVKRKAEEPEPSRKKSEKRFEFDNGSGSETQSLSCDEEDDDLTMDDVLSIAKEFVENDKRDTSQQKPPKVQSELRSESPPYVRSPTHEETDSHHEPVETTSKTTLADSIMTGDPAQDMLDVFLGSLLKKPIAKDETSSTYDITIPHETKNQQHNAVISNKPVMLTKKKSSLRDAVAMLLD